MRDYKGRYDMPGNPKAFKVHGVEVQKGPIVAHQPTMQTKSHSDFVDEEKVMMDGRYDGMVLKLHQPKE